MTTEGARPKPASIKGPSVVDRLRLWLRTKPALLDRLKPLARALGYATPLQRALRRQLAGVRTGRALQIGAHDGVTHDPFREFLIRPGWEAVVLEPNPAVFPALVENYRAHPGVVPRQLAVGYPARPLELWVVAEEFLARRPDGAVLSTLSSRSRSALEANLRRAAGEDAPLRAVTVPGATVEDVLEAQGWPRIDALFVDVEGDENAILLPLDWARVDARLVVFEHLLLADGGAAIRARLGGLGYACTRIDGDTLATRLGDTGDPRARRKN